MIVYAFSFFDSKTGLFSQPFYSVARAAAVRAAVDYARDPSSAFFGHHEDYTLFELGTFDDNTGVLTSHTALENLGLLAALCAPARQTGGNANG